MDHDIFVEYSNSNWDTITGATVLYSFEKAYVRIYYKDRPTGQTRALRPIWI